MCGCTHGLFWIRDVKGGRLYGYSVDNSCSSLPMLLLCQYLFLEVSEHDTGAEAIRVASSSSVLKAIGSAKEDAGYQSALAKRALQQDPDDEKEETEDEVSDESMGDASDDDAVMEAQADIGFSLLEGNERTSKKKALLTKDSHAAKKVKKEAQADTPKSTQPPKSFAATLSSGKGRGRGALNKASAEEEDSELTPGQESLVTKGEEALEKLKTNYSAEKLWEGGVRPRQIEALAKSSSQVSSKLSALPLTCQRGHDLSSEIMGQVSAIQEVFDLFTKLRADITPFLDTMEKEAEDVLLSCDMSVLSGMLLKTAAAFIKNTDSQASRLKAQLIF